MEKDCYTKNNQREATYLKKYSTRNKDTLEEFII